MLDLQDIATAYFHARRNKRRSPDAVEFEIHWERNCSRLLQSVCDHSFKARHYIFIAQHPRPREVCACDFNGRLLDTYIDMRMRPLLEARMTDRTFNNRKGMGQNACVNRLIELIYEESRGFEKDCYIFKLDLSGYFPNIRQDVAYAQLEEVLLSDYGGPDKDELLFMLQRSVYSYTSHHCDILSSPEHQAMIPFDKSILNKPDGVGASIGRLIWQNAANYYIDEVDRWLLSLGIKFVRYVDDIAGATSSKTMLLLLPELRRRLAKVGARLNENKFYFQHWSKGCEFLGVHIKADRVHANNRIVARAKRKAREFNRCVRPGKVEALCSSLNSYLGLLKNLNGFAIACDIVDILDRRWFEYVAFNRDRVCLQPKPRFKKLNLILQKYDRTRKGRTTAAAKRATARTAGRNAPV